MVSSRTCYQALYVILTVALGASAKTHLEQFEENLALRPLRDGRVLTRFSFKTLLRNATPRNPSTLGSDDESQHYTVFPLSLGQVLREYAVTELHLTLNAGKWDYDRWGYPYETGVGPGAELWAWMGDSSSATVDERWRGLRNALAGLFCASLSSLDELRTTSPYASFPPEGSLPHWNSSHSLRHASLPSEHVCTENLTPFLKMLPCKSFSGIASLLNPHRLFDADWHGMGVHVSWNPDEGVELRLSFQAVLDPLRSPFGNNKRDWSFGSLFDRTIERHCPAAHNSAIVIALPDDLSFTLGPDPLVKHEKEALYDVHGRMERLDIAMRWPEEHNFDYPADIPIAPVPVSIQRSLHGRSQDHGQLSVAIKNNNPTQIQVSYLETMPWLLQFFVHSIRVECNGTLRDDLISNTSYTPPIAHSRPTLFQTVLTLPPKSTIHVNIDIKKAFLRYTEHPPDAQRGWDLPPAIIIPLSNNTAGSHTHNQRIYSPALLVDLATPDFSMPYNVIIFSCSLMAFIFGSVFNLLTRKFVAIQLEAAVRVDDTDRRTD